MAQELNVPFLGELPIVPELREGLDHAQPLTAVDPGHPTSMAFKKIAGSLIEQISSLSAAAPRS
jgi:ATP-binding protein involved in chromosome partitioning